MGEINVRSHLLFKGEGRREGGESPDVSLRYSKLMRILFGIITPVQNAKLQCIAF